MPVCIMEVTLPGTRSMSPPASPPALDRRESISVGRESAWAAARDGCWRWVMWVSISRVWGKSAWGRGERYSESGKWQGS